MWVSDARPKHISAFPSVRGLRRQPLLNEAATQCRLRYATARPGRRSERTLTEGTQRCAIHNSATSLWAAGKMWMIYIHGEPERIERCWTMNVCNASQMFGKCYCIASLMGSCTRIDVVFRSKSRDHVGEIPFLWPFQREWKYRECGQCGRRSFREQIWQYRVIINKHSAIYRSE